MKKKLKYRVIFEGVYEVDPCDYDTEDVDLIAEMERDFAKADVTEYLSLVDAQAPEIVIIPK